MRYRIEGNKLTLTITDEERYDIKEWQMDGNFDRDIEDELLSNLCSNSELCEVSAEDTGDLTNAPMLAILGEETNLKEEYDSELGSVWSYFDGSDDFYRPILQRWAYMDYQTTSLVDELIETGEVTFVS